jgi:uncharacterized protein (DUF2147 family)
MRRSMFVAGLLAIHLAAFAQSSPVGTWKTVDDATRTEKSIVRITERDGELSGVIDKVLDPNAPPNPVCDKCADDRKGRPLVGLEIIRHTHQDADDPQLWTGGDILDPANGKTYRLRLKPVDGGKKLEVRGYIGTPMIGRTQTWLRAD